MLSRKCSLGLTLTTPLGGAHLQQLEHLRSSNFKLFASGKRPPLLTPLADHRSAAGQWAFKPTTHCSPIRASSGPGAAGQDVAHHGSIAFRHAASGLQADGQEDSSNQAAAKKQKPSYRALIKRQRPLARKTPILRKSARSRQRDADDCNICGGRGFQIIEEVHSWHSMPTHIKYLIDAHNVLSTAVSAGKQSYAYTMLTCPLQAITPDPVFCAPSPLPRQNMHIPPAPESLQAKQWQHTSITAVASDCLFFPYRFTSPGAF